MSRCLVLLQPFGGNPHSGFSASAREPLDPHLGSSEAVSPPPTLFRTWLGFGPRGLPANGSAGPDAARLQKRLGVSAANPSSLNTGLAFPATRPPPIWRVGCAQEREGMGRVVAVLIILDLSPPPAPLEKGRDRKSVV